MIVAVRRRPSFPQRSPSLETSDMTPVMPFSFASLALALSLLLAATLAPVPA